MVPATLSPFSTAVPPIPSMSHQWSSNEILHCDSAFSGPGIDPHDCRRAYAQLPFGSTPVRWSNRATGRDPRGLPVVRTYGSCSIKFGTSGRSPWDNGFFVPDQIREMARFVSEQCVFHKSEGGFVTRQFNNTESFLKDAYKGVDFGAGFPLTTTFFSLLIWNPLVDFGTYNPGNKDPPVGLSLYQSLYEAAAQERPHGTVRHVFEDRGRHIECAWKYMQRAGSSEVNWWDYHLDAGAELMLPVDDKLS